MKKSNLFLSILAVAGMLFATSCSHDEVINEMPEGEIVNAQFTISTTPNLDNRAAVKGKRAAVNVGKGTTVNYVACAVFDAAGNEMSDLRQYVAISDKHATYSVRLVKGQAYRVAFFAYCGASDGSSAHYNLADMKNIQVLDGNSNVEERDAFTNFVDVTAAETMNPVEKDVTLYRPFAQLNLGAYMEDIAAAKSAGVEIAKTEVKVTNVYKAFSAFANDIAEGATAQEMTFALNEIPGEDLKADVDQDGVDEAYKYLALNYLLVGGANSDKAVTDVTFTWKNADGSKTNDPATEFKNVPVQTNYRTNIIGYLLTNPGKFNITIDENFKQPDHFVMLSAEELANELTPDANGVINVTKDYYLTTAWTALDFTGKNVTINGNGHTIANLNKALVRITTAGNVSIKDLTISDSNIGYLASDGNEVALGTGGFISYMDYSGEISLENCHLINSTVTGKERAAGLVAYTSGDNLTIKNCSVVGCEIKAEGGTGGFVAYTGAKGATVVEDSKVEACTITSTEDRQGTKAPIAGGVIGTIQSTTTFKNVTVRGNTVNNNNATAVYSDKVGRVVNGGTLTEE